MGPVVRTELAIEAVCGLAATEFIAALRTRISELLLPKKLWVASLTDFREFAPVGRTCDL